MTERSEHFDGKSVLEHLREARLRGAMASKEIHGVESSGHFNAAWESCKDTALAFLIFFALFSGLSLPLNFTFLVVFAFGWLMWKSGRSALIGYARLERLHRLIEQERWEIEHHREQEKLELIEMYQAKGFSGKLLNEVVEVLMADDNRLLSIMLEEELGLTLEAFEHPLKQALGAFCGSLISIPLLIAHFYFPEFGIPSLALLAVLFAAYFSAKLERNLLLQAMIWNVAVALFVSLGVYFLAKIL